MRLDYALYVLAVVFFLITAVSFVTVTAQPERNLWVIATVVLALCSIGLGYYERPKVKISAMSQQTVSETTEDAQAKEAYKAEHVEKTVETSAVPESTPSVPVQPLATVPVSTTALVEVPHPATIDLKEVRGIGEKRAAQLKALGINSVNDLAKASTEDLATKLKVSPKIVEKWVAGAKEIVK